LYYSSNPADQLVKFSSRITWDDVSRSAKEARATENDRNITWDAVTHTAKKATASYNSKGHLRKLGRSFGNIAPAIVHKLDYAPDEMYIGVVCHGLKLVFDVSPPMVVRLIVGAKHITDRYSTCREATEDSRGF
jgi:hypothetical protein